MAENTQQQHQDAQPQKGKLASIGKVAPAKMVLPTSEQADVETEKVTPVTENADGKKEDSTKENVDANAASNSTDPTVKTPVDVPELSTEQIEKIFGYKGTAEEIKAKLKLLSESSPAEKTNEEKDQEERQLELEALTLFVQEKGTPEQFTLLKQIANAKPEDLSLSETKRELRDAGFKEEEIDSIIRDRYFQLSDDDVAQYDDETEKEFAIRKRKYFTERLNGKAKKVQEEAKNALQGLKDVVVGRKQAARAEVEFLSTVDKQLSELPRKIEFELGDADGKPIAPIQFDVLDTHIDAVANILKSKEETQKLFFNKDGSLNVSNITNLLVRNQILTNAVKTAYREASTRTIEDFKKVFPTQPHAVGLNNGSNSKGKPGKYTTVGKSQVANPIAK